MNKKIVFYLNGQETQVSGVMATSMLSDYLRYEKSLTGTKVVCAEGDCGACSVLRFHPLQKEQYFIPINSCLTPLLSLNGTSLVTVDELATNENELHPTQQSMVDCHGSQCGFCTPGFVMTLAGLTEEKLAKSKKTISEKDAKNALTGNLCRCTGYESIIKAACSINLKNTKSINDRFLNSAILKRLKEIANHEVYLEAEGYSLYAPTSINSALKYLKENPHTRILGAATDLGVLYNKKKIELTRLLTLHLVPELYELSLNNDQYYLGARISITEFRDFVKKDIPELSSYLDLFASPQIKNIATVIGNIANASPIGDLAVVLLALDAKIHFQSLDGARVLSLSDFFIDYKKINIKENEIIVGIEFNKPKDLSTFKFIKNSNRKDLDISTINFAIKLDFEDAKKSKIKAARFALGGVAATPIRLKKSEDYLAQNLLTKNTFDQFLTIVQSEFNPLTDLRGSSTYRRLVVKNYLARFLQEHHPEFNS